MASIRSPGGDPKPSLTTLPPEILRLICAALCPHCYFNGWDGGSAYCVNMSMAQAHVQKFARTCKTLRDVARSFRFHILGEDNLEAFNHLLARDPNALSLVRQMDLPTDSFGMPRLGTSYTKVAAADLGMDMDYYEGSDVFGVRENAQDKAQQEILTVAFPNLEQLCFAVDVMTETTNSLLCSYFQSLGDKPGLPSLRALAIVPADTEFGINFMSPTPVILIGAAPNLQILQLDGQNLPPMQEDSEVGGEEDDEMDYIAKLAPGLGNLRSLDMTNCAMTDEYFEHLQNFIQSCPKLESFLFNRDYIGERHEGEPISAARLVDAVGPAKVTLRNLDMNLSDLQNANTSDLCRHDQLIDFTRLQTLRLHEMSFCRHWVDEEDGEEGHPGDETTCLTGLLTPTIKELTVICEHKRRAWYDAVFLGYRAAEGDFPALKKFSVQVNTEHTRQEVRGGVFSEEVNQLVKSFTGTPVSVLIEVAVAGEISDDIIRLHPPGQE